MLFIFGSVSLIFQSEPLYVPVKFHDLPSEKPENTNTDTEKSKQNIEFHMGGNFSFIQAIPKLSGSGSYGSSFFHVVLAWLVVFQKFESFY